MSKADPEMWSFFEPSAPRERESKYGWMRSLLQNAADVRIVREQPALSEREADASASGKGGLR